MPSRAVALFAVLGLSGCSLLAPEPAPVIEYIPVPEAYLQECALPDAPVSTGELSEAFVIAFRCAEQGNKDKRRIREIASKP